MLPITNHKVHIPHAIALAAALIGLVAALSWDFRSSDLNSTRISSTVVNTEHSNMDDSSEPSAKQASSGGGASPSSQWSSSPVLPLFLPASPNGQ